MQHSTSGWVFVLNQAAVSWGSKKQKSVALSSCEAEIVAASEASKEAVHVGIPKSWELEQTFFPLRDAIMNVHPSHSEPARTECCHGGALNVASGYDLLVHLSALGPEYSTQ